MHRGRSSTRMRSCLLYGYMAAPLLQRLTADHVSNPKHKSTVSRQYPAGLTYLYRDVPECKHILAGFAAGFATPAMVASTLEADKCCWHSLLSAGIDEQLAQRDESRNHQFGTFFLCVIGGI
ncbi:uncharacterized protein B0I36DRAFT_59510 [Microdochium trichocladiopsis]|uniref:Uncharacterized protein n=1 Tax=Microdochium trichocladiopsis TaxID=1682393 RepID=A0A9P8XPR1_9PEZI|nr:uncharacterized protein B0I36DRAFT_59510 [Microdochium trichocladiopsis]KAH7009409.1 hypothetical protein B0I36DRAFT_59510 [Microdochium trichocladiopsis]